MTEDSWQDIAIRDRTIPYVLEKWAAQRPDKPFLLFEERSYSYQEFERITRKIANSFLALGVQRGSHVAAMMSNCPELLFTYFALVRIGAVVVPINTAARGDLLAYFLNQSDSVMAVADRNFFERMLEVRVKTPAVSSYVVFDEQCDSPIPNAPGAPVVDFLQLMSGSEASLPTPPAYSDLSHLSYTSGTTGPSKGSMSTHSHAVGQGLLYASYYGYSQQDILYTCLAVLQGNGFFVCTMPALVVGATVAMSRRFSATSFWDEVRAHKATQFNLLGSMTNILWAKPPSPDDLNHQVRKCMVVPIPAFGEEFEQRFGVQLMSMYGLTDFGAVVAKPPGAPKSKLRSSGKIVKNMDLMIADDEDFPLPPGEVGEVLMRSREPWSAPLGYYKMPEATCAAWRNLWFHSGDRGYFDEDGWFYFSDRKKDYIRRRGQNISSFEIEQIIATHPLISEVAAYGVQSEMSEDEVAVSVILREGESLSEVDLVAFCEKNMAYYMVPRYIEKVSEMPRTPTEKIQKFKLKEGAQARLHEIWDREKAGIKLTK